MNVLYISYDGALDLLGYSQIVPYVIGLSQKGFKFTLLTYEKNNKLKSQELLNKLKDNLKQEGINWEILRYHKSPTVLATAFDVLRGFMKGIKVILRDNIQLIHARSFVGAVPALLLAKIFKVKFIFDMRGFWADERVDGNIWNAKGVLYKVSKWFEKIFLLNADWVICLTQEARIIAKELPYLKNKMVCIDVIPTCADTTKFIVREKDRDLLKDINLQNRFIYIYFGQVGTWYMLEEMVDFFKIAKRINPASFFLILTTEEDFVCNIMMQKNISQGDYLVKQVPYSEMPNWISLADASISFIKPLYSKISSCPTKFAEALACGIPVVINSKIGDTDKFVCNYNIGTVIESFSDEGYYRGARQLLKLLDNRDYLRNNCRKVAEDFFSLQNGVEQYSKIYQKLNTI